MNDPITLDRSYHLDQLVQVAEIYYVSKYIRQYDNVSAGPMLRGDFYPNPLGPIGPEGPAGGPPRGPLPFDPRPPIPPFVFDPRIAIDQYISKFDSPLANWGLALGDPDPAPNILAGNPNPQPSLRATVQSTEFHLEAAENALKALDEARDALKGNIEKLQAMQRT